MPRLIKEALICASALLAAFVCAMSAALVLPDDALYTQIFQGHRADFVKLVGLITKKPQLAPLGPGIVGPYQEKNTMWWDPNAQHGRPLTLREVATSLACTENEIRDNQELCAQLGLQFIDTEKAEGSPPIGYRCAFLDGMGRREFFRWFTPVGSLWSGAKNSLVFRDPKIAPNNTEKTTPDKENSQTAPAGWSLETTLGNYLTTYTSLPNRVEPKL